MNLSKIKNRSWLLLPSIILFSFCVLWANIFHSFAYVVIPIALISAAWTIIAVILINVHDMTDSEKHISCLNCRNLVTDKFGNAICLKEFVEKNKKAKPPAEDCPEFEERLIPRMKDYPEPPIHKQ